MSKRGWISRSVAPHDLRRTAGQILTESDPDHRVRTVEVGGQQWSAHACRRSYQRSAPSHQPGDQQHAPSMYERAVNITGIRAARRSKERRIAQIQRRSKRWYAPWIRRLARARVSFRHGAQRITRHLGAKAQWVPPILHTVGGIMLRGIRVLERGIWELTMHRGRTANRIHRTVIQQVPAVRKKFQSVASWFAKPGGILKRVMTLPVRGVWWGISQFGTKPLGKNQTFTFTLDNGRRVDIRHHVSGWTGTHVLLALGHRATLAGATIPVIPTALINGAAAAACVGLGIWAGLRGNLPFARGVGKQAFLHSALAVLGVQFYFVVTSASTPINAAVGVGELDRYVGHLQDGTTKPLSMREKLRFQRALNDSTA